MSLFHDIIAYSEFCINIEQLCKFIFALFQTFIYCSKAVAYKKREESNKEQTTPYKPTLPNTLLGTIQFKKKKKVSNCLVCLFRFVLFFSFSCMVNKVDC